jgi:cytochrome c-type biogenesis protein CcmF
MILALALSACQAFFGIAGAQLKRERWLAVVPSAVAGQFLFLCIGTFTLVHAFVVNDFSVRYVAEHSNSALPLFYRIAALWGAHEGSLLLWIFVLGLWTIAVATRTGHLPRAYVGRVLGVLGVVNFGFLLFLLSTSSPFVRLIPPAVDGNDLNPLLQDFAMAIHPPILYAGYVGMSVSFAFACAAMLEGRTDNAWARWQRPWTIMAWAFLSCGIALGSWWAYYELGWGGWWFWDPV